MKKWDKRVYVVEEGDEKSGKWLAIYRSFQDCASLNEDIEVGVYELKNVSKVKTKIEIE